MSTRQTADIIFCIDASSSMGPALSGVCKHISTFVRTLKNENQNGEWDVRFDFLAHAATEIEQSEPVFWGSSVHHAGCISIWDDLYSSKTDSFFTSDVDKFVESLATVQPKANEFPLLALDTCLDFPWRNQQKSHRVIIFLTDEPLEEGVQLEQSRKILGTLIQKMMDLGILLFLVTPESNLFAELATADKCEWEIAEEQGMGLTNLRFDKLLQAMAKSISKSQAAQAVHKDVTRALFKQNTWVLTQANPTGR